MSLTLNMGDATFASSPTALRVLAPEALQVVQNTGQLVKLVNVLSPLDKQANFKIANTRIADVYTTLAKGTIPLAARAANISGQTIFAELSAVASRSASGVETLLPVVARLELRLPNDHDIDEDFVKLLVGTVLAAVCQIGDIDNPEEPVTRVTEIMRGVLFRDS